MTEPRPGEPEPEEPGHDGADPGEAAEERESVEDAWEARLRRTPDPLPPPPGKFDRIRRAARARRRARGLGAGATAALAIAALLTAPTLLRTGGFDTVDVGPPVAGSPSSGAPALPPRHATESSEVVPTPPARGTRTSPDGPSARPSGPDAARNSGPSVPLCGTERLTATMTEPVLGTAYGSRTAELVLTNGSPGSCLIAGYPALALLDGERTAIDTETAPATTPMAERLVLAPGEAVRAVLSWTTVPEADELLGCFPVPAWLRVRPPGGLSWLETGWRGQEVCRHGRVELGPLRPSP
ncbi:MAG: DUF4232 domain-containing protein [Streptosporangiales bacterium]|nr:DUF4232 domain-containing protein [Streptosporangiales bacterium]